MRKILLTISLGISLLIGATASFAADVFTVSNVEVDVKGVNAVQAKENAFAEARRQAFDKLVKRLLTETEIEALPQPSDAEITSLIQNFEIIKENMAPKQYVAEFSFTFKEEATKRFFEGGGYSFSDIGGDPLLVLPYYQEDGITKLWGEENPWYQAWQRVDTYSEGLVPVLVPLGDLADIQDVSDTEPLSYLEDDLLDLSERYNASAILIALLTLNDEDAQIHLYRTDQPRAQHVKTIPIDKEVMDETIDQERKGQIFRNAVRDVYGFLQRNWKKQTAISASSRKASLKMGVDISSLSDWVVIKERLDDVSAITSYDVLTLSPSNVEIRIHFSGSFERLQLVLNREGLVVEQPRIQGYYDDYGMYNSYQDGASLPMLRLQ